MFYDYALLGGPGSLSEEDLDTAIKRAKELMREEQMRTKGGFEKVDGFNPNQPLLFPTFPDIEIVTEAKTVQKPSGTGLNSSMIYRFLPHLKEIPQETLQGLPWYAIFQLNTALATEAKEANRQTTSAKLAANSQRMVSAPTQVTAGYDDRRANLHTARFLGGASCSAQALWLQARDFLGVDGTTPLGNYDMDAVGCGGCVTPKGWYELHNPGSSELKLKLFYLPNVASSAFSSRKINLDDSENSVCIGDSLREIADFEGFRAALHSLKEALHWALPWNRSVSAIQGFMVNSNYCFEDLKSSPKRAQVLTEFVDFVLGRNALNWVNRMPFLTADELAHTWASWKGKRSAFILSTKQERTPFVKREKNDICRRYQNKTCTNKAEDCKTPGGLKLRHVCAWVYSGGKRCEKEHPKVEHK